MHKLFSVALAAALFGLAGAARADVCLAPFFRNGGHVVWSGTGMLQMSADLTFSDVRRMAQGSCSAHVQGKASIRLAGLPAGKTRVDHIVTIENGQSTFARVGRPAAESAGRQLDLRLLGLFGYDGPITRAGQRFPARSFQLRLGEAGADPSVPAGSLTVHLKEKTVGARQPIETPLGWKSCWPVRYERITDPTYASFNGVPLPLPGMQSKVTDWVCPDVNLVMRQEIEQAGQRSVIEVTKIE